MLQWVFITLKDSNGKTVIEYDCVSQLKVSLQFFHMMSVYFYLSESFISVHVSCPC